MTIALLLLGAIAAICLIYALGARHGLARERRPADADGPGWDS